MIRIMKYGEIPNTEIFSRVVPEINVEDVVTDIIKNVRSRGDEALYEYCRRFDGAELSSLAVTEKEIAEAVARVDERFLDVLRRAAANIDSVGE